MRGLAGRTMSDRSDNDLMLAAGRSDRDADQITLATCEGRADHRPGEFSSLGDLVHAGEVEI